MQVPEIINGIDYCPKNVVYAIFGTSRTGP